MEIKNVIAGTPLDLTNTGKIVTRMQPVGASAMVQALGRSDYAGSTEDYAVDGVYTPANDANASMLVGFVLNEVGYTKVAVATGSSPVMVRIDLIEAV